MDKEKDIYHRDVHGCLDMLKRLLDKIPWRPGQDALIFIGDCIDRGRNSKGVVDSIIDLILNYPHVSCLLGNHEAMLLNYLSGKDQDLYIDNKGLTTLKSYSAEKPEGEGPLVPPDHISFYRSLEPFMELRDYYPYNDT